MTVEERPQLVLASVVDTAVTLGAHPVAGHDRERGMSRCSFLGHQ